MSSPGDVASKTVVLVEDDEAIRRLYADCLRRTGFVVVERGHAHDLVDIVRVHRPAVLLLDLALPGIDGVTACRMVKSDESLPPVRVIMMTANATPEAERQAKLAGIDYFLVKPVLPSRLVALLRAEAPARPTTTPSPLQRCA